MIKSGEDNEYRRSGKEVVELVRKQAWYKALDTLYDKDVVSVERQRRKREAKKKCVGKSIGASMRWKYTASMQVSRSWYDRFVVQYDADVTDKSSKQRRHMSEVGVYTVKNGKIVRGEFLARV